jgi:hypothetical protein
MQRRDFLTTVGSGALLAAASPFVASVSAVDATRKANVDPIGGDVANPPKDVPHGIRFVAQPARIDAVAGDPPVVTGQVLEVDGSHLAIDLRVEYPPGKDLGANSTAVPQAVSSR